MPTLVYLRVYMEMPQSQVCTKYSKFSPSSYNIKFNKIHPQQPQLIFSKLPQVKGCMYCWCRAIFPRKVVVTVFLGCARTLPRMGETPSHEASLSTISCLKRTKKATTTRKNLSSHIFKLQTWDPYIYFYIIKTKDHVLRRSQSNKLHFAMNTQT